ncbi:MAG: hypothetical protein P4L50_21720 [Anaerolineaceae bacterium]|nr:hypothetical protein [Anaerolineaceae bacterium]
MKSLIGLNRLFIVLLVMALAQLACNFSTSLATGAAQPTRPPASLSASSGASQTTLPAPASASQPTQLPAATTTSKYGTVDQAMTMLQKAVEHYNLVGRTQALADFNHRVAPFFDRDLYVACIDSNLKQSANGGYPNLVGSSIEPISRAAWDAAAVNKIGTVNYQWLDPATGTTLPKTFYYEKVGSDVCGVGAYHP